MKRRTWLVLTALIASWATSLSTAFAIQSQPMLEKTDLFAAGKDEYALYRIPGIVVTTKGTLLAYCEARKTRSGDWGTIDIMLRRSADGGRTWTPMRKIAEVAGPKLKNPVALAQKLANPGDVTYNNPVAIVDRETGTVHFLFCLEYMRCFYMQSRDDGQTFSKPVEITSVFDKFRPEYDWRVLATGPGHGIQLDNGRLVVPIWLSTGTGGHAHRPSVASVIYSSDHGQTWNRGEIAAHNIAELINPSETVAVQLTDGRVMLNMRTESKAHRRAITYSRDGATKWTQPIFHEQLLEPICMASIVRLSQQPKHNRNRIVFANPHNLDPTEGAAAVPGKSRSRKNISIKLSYDEGLTWTINKTVEPALSGYSDLAVGADGTIYLFYERSSVDGDIYRTGLLTVARFNLEWLTDGKDSWAAKR